MNIRMVDKCGIFAENKDIARNIRETVLKPALKEGNKVVFDFDWVDSTTQSFIHALISGVVKKHGEDILDQIEFRNCLPAVKSLITTVINYSL